ncbi:transglycosylase SLT domain-containing protein [Micromonospora sp. NPDC093277]|uniref:transglycosylase SLT domain-containing protein n=1 Tax=Micromonospora sp. NPDC093277 TaxID=3364291 RepID=UPI0037F7C0EA
MRRGIGRWATATAALLLAVGIAGCGGEQRPPSGVAADLPSEVPVEAAADEPTEAPPAVEAMGVAPSTKPKPSATPTAKPKPTRTSAGPLAKPKPATETKVPPAPKKPPVSSDCKPSYRGTKATTSQVKVALSDAAAKTYWPTSAPTIKIPLNLVKATAWQESGWQSNIVACDTGVGLMQVMPDTAKWMNDRFGQSYDIEDYRDNAFLGANYLAWLTKYIGDMYFGDEPPELRYRLDASLCTGGLDSCLLNAVISAYNFGHGAVAQMGKPIAIPNPTYVENVRALMTNCVCLGY